MKLTAHLKNLLTHYQSELPPGEYDELEAETNRMVKVYFDLLSPFAPGAGRARKIHQLVEEQNLRNAHVPTACTKGCGACCHLEVEITEDDAKLLAQTVQERQIKIDFSRLENQALRKRADERWKKRTTIENRCVFLDEANCCGVYDVRPMICRKHSVVSPASECMTEEGMPVPRVIPLNEIIASAVINLPGNRYDSLAKMLLPVLNQEKELAQIHTLQFVESEKAQIQNEPAHPEVNLKDREGF